MNTEEFAFIEQLFNEKKTTIYKTMGEQIKLTKEKEDELVYKTRLTDFCHKAAEIIVKIDTTLATLKKCVISEPSTPDLFAHGC